MKMPRSGFVRRHEAAFGDFHIFLVGALLVVRVSTLRAEDLGFDSCLCRGKFSGWSHTSDFKIDTPVATPPDVRQGKSLV